LRHAARRDAIASRPSKKGQEYPRGARLVRKADFDAVYRNGKRRSSSHFTVFLKANELPESRFGFSIGGPVIPKKILGGKTYLFFNYEGFRFPGTGIFERAYPTSAMRAGVVRASAAGMTSRFQAGAFWTSATPCRS